MNTKFFMDNQCFACGAENTNGLRMRVSESAEGVESIIKLPFWCQGYKKTVHGGIISLMKWRSGQHLRKKDLNV